LEYTTIDLLLAYQAKQFFKNIKVTDLLKPFEAYLEEYPSIESAKGLLLQTGKDSTRKMLFKVAVTLKTLRLKYALNSFGVFPRFFP
jgi:hypothetical protein